ncbi:MAG: GlsB/YeaQ/YmgE family stress response membrane protein [Chloroflexi bacterium]|nr:GlsB/YeaQ/YmgE family stress response membrane protein [Chloroflexota bacterium]
MTLDPGGILAWLLVGLIAGWLAGLVMRGGGFGIVGDIIVGIVGAVIGGFLFGLIFPGTVVGFWGSIVVAFLGAVILIAIVRALAPRRAAA